MFGGVAMRFGTKADLQAGLRRNIHALEIDEHAFKADIAGFAIDHAYRRVVQVYFQVYLFT